MKKLNFRRSKDGCDLQSRCDGPKFGTGKGTDRDIYSGHSPSPWGGEFLSKVKNREEFGKGGKIRKKEKRVIKHTLEYLYEA